MSLEKFIAGLRFRTNRPAFEPEAEHVGFVTGREGETPLIRVGDTVLRLEGDAPVDAQVAFRVTEFDETESTGRAELLRVVSDPD